jgi:hypothetical protein
MGQRLLHWIEKQATEGEMLVCDLYLKKGAEYEIRGRISKDAGEMQLSIRSAIDAPIRSFAYRRGFGFIAPEEGMYQVWARIRPIQGKEPSGRAVVTVNQARPVRSVLFDGAPFFSYAEQPLGKSSSQVHAPAEKRTDRHPEHYEQRRAG